MAPDQRPGVELTASSEFIACWCGQLLLDSQRGRRLNTAFIAPLNASFRSMISALGPRTRAMARTQAHREAGRYLAGGVYHGDSFHGSLSRPLVLRGVPGEVCRQIGRTPAMAARLTDPCWTVLELLRYRMVPDGVRPTPTTSSARTSLTTV